MDLPVNTSPDCYTVVGYEIDLGGSAVTYASINESDPADPKLEIEVSYADGLAGFYYFDLKLTVVKIGETTNIVNVNNMRVEFKCPTYVKAPFN